MATPQELQVNLDQINISSGLDQVLGSAANLINTQLAAITTTVGVDINVPVNGIQPLVQVLDDIAPSVLSSTVSQVTGVLGVAQLTQKVPGFQTDLVKQVGASKSDLDLITGSTSSTGNGFLDVVITAPFADAIAQAVTASVPTANAAKLKTAVTGIQQFGVGELANVTNSNQVLSSLVGAVSNTTSSLNSLKSNLTSLFSQKASLALSSLGQFSSTLAENVKVVDTSGITIRANQLDEGAKNWNGASTPRGYGFSMIGTHEELEVELKSVSREITGLVVHWSETFYNQDIGADDIHYYNSKVGDGIPYHYVIRRDGSIQRGRPIDKPGGQLPNNHHTYSIQVVIVGGINAPVGTPDPKKYFSKASFTRQQMNTFDVFLEKAYMAWPGLQVMGHNDIDRLQKDPGFDVPDYVYNKFGKTLVYADPSAEAALSRSAISTLRVTE
jgi:N-acetyl-anhydromuramyl-L-alanine amidase AmpD